MKVNSLFVYLMLIALISGCSVVPYKNVDYDKFSKNLKSQSDLELVRMLEADSVWDRQVSTDNFYKLYLKEFKDDQSLLPLYIDYLSVNLHDFFCNSKYRESFTPHDRNAMRAMVLAVSFEEDKQKRKN